jgi:uncharacterized membrane protein
MDSLFNFLQPLALVGVSVGIGSFSWALYNYPHFRRKTIENIFNGSDYIYDKYYKLRYDDKIREVEIRTGKTLSLSRVSYKDNDYYVIKSEKQVFKLDDIIELPWLAVSLKVETKDDQHHEIEITNKWKQFWVKINELPFHMEYYDLWIKELLSELAVEKDEIKRLELLIIDETGNFITHNNVLIKPHSQSNQIDLIPISV